MNKYFKSTLLVTLILAATLYFPLASSSRNFNILEITWGTPDNPLIVSPGDIDTALTLVILNNNDITACGIVASLTKPVNYGDFPFKDSRGRSVIVTYLERRLAPQEIGRITFRIDVDRNAQPGIYKARLLITYRDCSDPDFPSRTFSTLITLKLDDTPKPRFLRAVWEEDGVKTTAGPGAGIVTLRVFLEAPQKTEMANIVAELLLPKGLKNSTGGDVVKARYLERVASGEVFNLAFPLQIPEDAELGSYRFELKIQYTNHWLTRKTTTITFEASLEGREKIEVRMDKPREIEIGSTAELTLSIINSGTAPAFDVKISLTPPAAGIMVLDNFFETPVINPREEFKVNARLFISQGVVEGEYPITVGINYVSAAARRESKDSTISINVIKPQNPGFSVNVKENRIMAGKTSETLEITLTNLNPYTVYDVRIVFSFTNIPVTLVEGNQVIYLESMEQGRRVDVKLKVAASPEAGDSTHLIPVSIRYRTPAGVERLETLEAPILIYGNIELNVRNIQVSPTVASPGEVVDIAGDIINIGLTRARAVDVSLEGEEPYVEIPESRNFVGEISPSQVSTFTLSFKVEDNAKPGDYSVTLRVRYINGFGEEFEVTRKIEYSVTKPPEVSPEKIGGEEVKQYSLPASLMVVFALAAAAVVAVVIKRVRRK